MRGRWSCAGSWARRRNSSWCWVDCIHFISYGRSCRRRESWRSSSCGWPKASKILLSCCGPHVGLGLVLCNLGEPTAALLHLERGIAVYDPPKHRPDRSQVYGQDPKVTCLSYAAVTLWTLGYPDQARQRITEALTLAQELSHPFSLAFALNLAAALDQFLRDGPAVQERTEALLTLAREQGFPHWLALGAIRQGWVLAEQGRGRKGWPGCARAGRLCRPREQH